MDNGTSYTSTVNHMTKVAKNQQYMKNNDLHRTGLKKKCRGSFSVLLGIMGKQCSSHIYIDQSVLTGWYNLCFLRISWYPVKAESISEHRYIFYSTSIGKWTYDHSGDSKHLAIVQLQLSVGQYSPYISQTENI